MRSVLTSLLVHIATLTENGYLVVQVYRKVAMKYQTLSCVASVLPVTLQIAGF